MTKKIDEQWKQFVQFALDNFGSINFAGHGLCYAFCKHAGSYMHDAHYYQYCCKRIAAYRHKAVKSCPWKDSMRDNPTPRQRFIKHEAKRLGLSNNHATRKRA